MNESGFGYVSSTVLDGRRVLRLVVMNPQTTVSDVHELLRRVEQLTTDRRRSWLREANAHFSDMPKICLVGLCDWMWML